MESKLCSGCGKPRDRNGRYCRSCHNAYMRQWRQDHPEPYKQPRRARSLANVAVSRGKLERQPCEICGSTEAVEKHHDDYDRPLDVRWLCRTHHHAHHKAVV